MKIERTPAIDTIKKIGQEVVLKGWVNTRRNHGKIIFIDLRDRSGIVQLVCGNEAKGLRPEDVIEVEGTVVERSKNTINLDLSTGTVEIKTSSIKILSTTDEKLPIAVAERGVKEPGREKRLNWRWLDLRKPEKQLIFKVWTVMELAFRKYCTENGYIQIHSPKLMSTASESGGEVFEVQYFDRKAYLAQSPQFYKQMAMAAGFEKVFEVGPVFRANKSFTSRHDTEFTMYDIEISFIDSHQDVIREEEKFIVAMLKAVKENFGKEIEKIYRREVIVPEIPFPQVTMKEAKSILSGVGVLSKSEEDLSPKEERSLSEFITKKKGHEFVFVTDYPAEARPFYHMRYEDNPRITKSFDLLWNGLEITTGAQREHRYEILIEQAREAKLEIKPLQHYFNFFKYGCPPHGGCAPGPTRMLMKIFDIDNVREVTYLYRGVKRLKP